eukprot:TRINITY_DN17622_c0_g1_i1.p1 TRINITY_DN17622_c0_g1~~TRINITY_DN17622_c0_g1_i1.p1  ORF type:complete len:425 (+),score=56.39 TRINITY_DN17622_c0_g1_i1:75-1349(+)
MLKRDIAKVIADAATKHRTPKSVALTLGRPSDTVVMPPDTGRTQIVDRNLALGWSDLRTLHFLAELGSGLSRLISHKKGNLRDRQINDACLVFLQEFRKLEKQGAVCDCHAYTGVLGFMSKYNKWSSVLDITTHMQKERIKITANHLRYILEASLAVDPSKVLTYWKKYGVVCEVAFRPEYLSYVILAKGRLGDEVGAFRAFADCRQRGITPTVDLYHAILSCCSSVKVMLPILKQMELSQTPYNVKCLSAVLTTCTVDPNIVVAEKFWATFVETGGVPCGRCCRLMFVLLRTEGSLERARDFVDSICKKQGRTKTLVKEVFFIHAIRDIGDIMQRQSVDERLETFKICSDIFRHGLAYSDLQSPPKLAQARSPHLFAAMFVAASLSKVTEVAFALRDMMASRGIAPTNEITTTFQHMTGSTFF